MKRAPLPVEGHRRKSAAGARALSPDGRKGTRQRERCVRHLSLAVVIAMSGAAISCSLPVRPLLFRQVFRACALFADSCIPPPPFTGIYRHSGYEPP
jgi:hypothetical protein